jgi:hypothetical protein
MLFLLGGSASRLIQATSLPVRLAGMGVEPPA